MSFTHQWIDNNILIELKGTLSFKVLLEANSLLFSNPKFDHLNYQILSFLMVDKVVLTKQEMLAYSLLHRGASRWNPCINVAIVATEPMVLKAFEDYLVQMNQSGWECKFFNSIQKAQDWCSHTIKTVDQ